MLKDIGKLARSLPLTAGLFSSLNWAVYTVCLCLGQFNWEKKMNHFFLSAILPEMPKFIWASRARKSCTGTAWETWPTARLKQKSYIFYRFPNHPVTFRHPIVWKDLLFCMPLLASMSMNHAYSWFHPIRCMRKMYYVICFDRPWCAVDAATSSTPDADGDETTKWDIYRLF